jgi:hypothetical protein
MESPLAARVLVSLWLDDWQPQIFAVDATQGVSVCVHDTTVSVGTYYRVPAYRN